MIGVGGASVLFCEGGERGKGGGLETRNIKSWAGIDFFVISWDLSSREGRFGLKNAFGFFYRGALFDLLGYQMAFAALPMYTPPARLCLGRLFGFIVDGCPGLGFFTVQLRFIRLMEGSRREGYKKIGNRQQ